MTDTGFDPRRLAIALVDAARRELELTPKPGLVDRQDNGSHPDLSFELMSRSIDLLPQYFEELLQIAGAATGRPPGPPTCIPGDGADRPPRGSAGLPGPQHVEGRRSRDELNLSACIAAGRRAEARMAAAIGSNGHRGYIFLAGLLLLAAARRPRGVAELRAALAGIAERILAEGRDHPAASTTNGAVLRRRLSVGGIHAEAVAGLPSVFDHGLPVFGRAVARFGDTARAQHLLMASLMAVVEDTTALHRCGPGGLERLRRDGRRLVALIEGDGDYLPVLAALNGEYRAMGLTMGGVADCMAVTMAVGTMYRS